MKNYSDCSLCDENINCIVLCKDHPEKTNKPDFFDELSLFEEGEEME